MGPTKFRCNVCALFLSEKAYLTHEHKFEQKPDPHICPACKWPFDDLPAFENHKAATGHGGLPYECNRCDEAFTTQVGLNKHRKFPNKCSDEMYHSSPMPSSDSTHSISQNRTGSNGHHILKPSLNVQQPPQNQGNTSKKPSPNNEIQLRDENARKIPQNQAQNLSSQPQKLVDTSEIDLRSHDILKLSEDQILQLFREGRLPPGFDFGYEKQGNKKAPRRNGVIAQIIAKEKARKAARNQALSPSPAQNGAPRNSAVGQSLAQNTASRKQSPSSIAFQSNSRRVSVSSMSPLAPSDIEEDPSSLPKGDENLRKLDPLSSDQGQRWPKNRLTTPFLGAGARRAAQTSSSSEITASENVDKSPPLLPAKDVASSKPAPSQKAAPDVFSRNLASSPLLAQGFVSNPTMSPLPGFAASQKLAPVPLPPPPTVQHFAPKPIKDSQPKAGPDDMAQANRIHLKMVRLFLQSDLYIHHDGKVTYNGMEWKRISKAKQEEATRSLEGLCHLPKRMQGEYLPHPKAFKNELYQTQPASADFESSPPHDISRPGLAVVAISCSIVILADGSPELVKFAAIDVNTCRVLIHHFVCTDPTATVKHWRSEETGLSSFGDIEAARQAEYKVFRGWKAARKALWKFVDDQTIIVGHNLRSDLDVLRMIHGRAVDVVKVIEKATQGPLSKDNLQLDNLCKELLEKTIPLNTKYGRDCLQDAFAARELGLWSIMNGDKLNYWAQQKSQEVSST